MRMLAATALGLGLIAGPLSAGPAQAQTTLNVWHVFNLETDMIHDGIAQFEAAHPDITVEQRVLPFSQLQQELIRAIVTGEVPDVVTIDNPVVASFASQGSLEEIGPALAERGLTGDNFHSGPWASVTWDGRVYGAPRASNTIALYYNADMFAAAGLDPDAPPPTWSELMAAAEALTDRDANVFGIAFSAIQSEEGTFQFLPWLQQAGAGPTTLDSEGAVAALQFWVDLVENGYASRDVVTMRQYEATNTMIAGNAAMAISGPWELPRIAEEADFDWRVARLPVKDDVGIEASALGGFDWAVPAGAEDVEAAVDFIAFMNSPEVLGNAWNTGRLPARSDVEVTDPQWPEAFATFSAQLASARARGPHPRWPDISLAIQNAVQQALTGLASPEEALAQAAEIVGPILEETPLPE